MDLIAFILLIISVRCSSFFAGNLGLFSGVFVVGFFISIFLEVNYRLSFCYCFIIRQQTHLFLFHRPDLQ